MVWVFVWRDVTVRYKQTLLGVGWIVLQPLLSTVVFTLVFGRIVKVPTGGVPYSVFVLSGLLPWQVFARGLVRCSNCLVDNQYVVSGSSVPRLILPVAAVLNPLVDFGIEVIILLLVMLLYGLHPGMGVILVVPPLLLALILSLSLGLCLSAANVWYRDIAYAVPFFLQLWFFITPVAYPSNLAPVRWQFLYLLNPMAAVVENFRAAILQGAPPAQSTFSTAGVAVCFLILTLLYFRRTERRFADVI